MRRLPELLPRFLVALALLIAAWPVRAGVEATLPKVSSVCRMGCCAVGAKKTMASPACCRGKAVVGPKAERCPCELKTAPPTPPHPLAVASSPFDPQLVVAVSNAAPGVSPGGLVWPVPGIVGTDSGPPIAVPRRHRPSRAPPVVRA